MEIEKETSREFFHGHIKVGTVAKRLTNGSFKAARGILLRAPGTRDPSSNTVPIWVGGKGVEANSEDLGGMPIPPGESLCIPVEDSSLIYVVSTEEDQDLAWWVA
jgi:hypothetical protein